MHHRSIICVGLIAISASRTAIAQPVAERAYDGVVTADAGVPIEGASVIDDAGPTVATDALDHFVITPSRRTRTQLVMAPGFAPTTVRLGRAGAALSVVLRPDRSSDGIVVASKAPEQTAPTGYGLIAASIRTLPGADNDALRAVQPLPGVAAYRRGTSQSRNLGLELMLRRDVGRTMAMVAYTFARAARTDDLRRVLVGWRPYALDQAHNLHVVGGIQLTHWQLGAQLSVATGNPYQPSGTFDDMQRVTARG